MPNKENRDEQVVTVSLSEVMVCGYLAAIVSILYVSQKRPDDRKMLRVLATSMLTNIPRTFGVELDVTLVQARRLITLTSVQEEKQQIEYLCELLEALIHKDQL